METLFSKVDETQTACKLFLQCLANSRFSYHIDDDPREVIDIRNDSRLFSDIQADAITANLETCKKVYSWTQIWEIYFPDWMDD